MRRSACERAATGRSDRPGSARPAQPSRVDGSAVDLADTSLYINRELSWLDFNDRVLQLAEDESLPLIERLKFLAIFVTNLDEFFMVRVAGVHDQVDARIDARGPDGLSPTAGARADRRPGPRARPPPLARSSDRGPPGAGRRTGSGSSRARSPARPRA